ncbi:hypothetical protein [Actinomadura parmotrematis]|uniref:Uncharacterized protein n=1 Tax=Actinomadura parmotrematis TaxID=2864039 RepID=A0ABS7FNQ8_9ACTN|nr:hypothetical protein [Actinomadura parmotrematis]MBW8482008.1 hypothetical protein [Actinomadura parmotrematis]
MGEIERGPLEARLDAFGGQAEKLALAVDRQARLPVVEAGIGAGVPVRCPGRHAAGIGEAGTAVGGRAAAAERSPLEVLVLDGALVNLNVGAQTFEGARLLLGHARGDLLDLERGTLPARARDGPPSKD